MGIWETVPLKLDESLRWQIGPLVVCVRSKVQEVHIAYWYEENEPAEESSGPLVIGELPEDLIWSRYVVSESADAIHLIPALPDRPVVVSPEYPIKLTPGSRALFFVSIPVWVQVKTGKGAKTALLEIPSRVLSNSWIGDTLIGEVSYALSSRARRRFESEQSIDSYVLCPVSLHNTGADTIDFQDFSIHAEHLRVYRGKHRLWSSEVRVYYRGVLQPPVIDYSKKPAYEEECELVSKERVAIDRSILRRYLSLIKKVSKSD